MTFFKRVINTTIPGTQPQINNNTQNSNNNATNLAVNDRPYITNLNYSNNFSEFGNLVDNLYRAAAAGDQPPQIPSGRTITFNNNIALTNIDLYLTVGGLNPKPLTLIAANIPANGGSHVWNIPLVYGWTGNFTAMPAGTAPPKYNAGPTIAEFGLNQFWHSATPPLRDTFDISTVPPGIGGSVNNGPRLAAVAASVAAGFSQQQAYNYNIGIQIIPPAGILQTQTVTCTATDGNSINSIGYPNDTAYPKQQTGVASGNYTVNFVDPVVKI